MLLGAIIVVIGKMKKIAVQNRPVRKAALWFTLIGLSGSLPLMVTLEQREFYLTTALPFFAIAIAVLISPIVSALQNKTELTKRSFSIFKFSATILLISSVVFATMQIGKYKRDKDLLQDIYAINTIVPYGEIISVSSVTWNKWSIQNYFNRYNYVSLEDIKTKAYRFCVVNKNEQIDPALIMNYSKLLLQTNQFDLYQLKHDSVIPH